MSVTIGNASGFYGDRFAAVHEMLTGGPLDVLTGDYLAELTMMILGRDRMKDPRSGYAKTFLRQMEDCLGLARERNVKIVTNAGGLNPAGLAEALHDLAGKLGVPTKIAYVTGDDLMDRAASLGLGMPLTANAYLGAWGIAECLREGADVIVTGRVTDASLVVGPAAAHFGWARDDFDALAGAVVAGHVLECGAQATGGNFSFFTEISLAYPGFPLAIVERDGSCVITKHPGTGGAVTVETVTAQLLYEIDSARYAGPDVTARFDTIELAQDGPDRVRISGVKGEPPPPKMKVCLNNLAGFRNDVTFVLTGLDIEAKAELVRQQMAGEDLEWRLARTDHVDADGEAEASALLHVTAKGSDPQKVGRAFSSAAVELALASYPGFTLTAPPGDATPYAVYTAAYIDPIPHTAVLHHGQEITIDPTRSRNLPGKVPFDEVPMGQLPGNFRDLDGPAVRAPLGRVVGARSGDKGGNANIGVWARSERGFHWLASTLTVARLKELLPEAGELTVTRHVLPNLRALNFVVEGILGEGVSSGTRFDPQGKGLGEWLRSRYADIPEELL
ncbi:MAG TPA: acyclic terpene utilization AtuA family protein [Candidatus Limnocylindrales bacterium]|nr:acyclic terpene utilization AtuA family protein [Candidatus Limnocylindrales bacterium]